jgi:small-conductance mechanosensitive channel
VVGLAYDTDLDRATEVLVEAVGRVPRISATPPAAVMLTEFGESTIDITIYYWHRSDVPSALATRHDLMIAVHHALADAGITIAFPQMVVWPSHDAADNPYGREPDPDVFTERPNAPLPPGPAAQEPSSRLPWRR